MRLELGARERVALEAAAAVERRARVWRRYRAILLLAERGPGEVAVALGCSRASVYGWAAAWREQGWEGLRERPHPGPARRLAGGGEAALEALLAEDRQACGRHATGWTVPQLRQELAAAGYTVGERTIRRALHRLGWGWKRPKYVLGRPDPAYAEKKGPLPSGPRRS
jgi:transposase